MELVHWTSGSVSRARQCGASCVREWRGVETSAGPSRCIEDRWPQDTEVGCKLDNPAKHVGGLASLGPTVGEYWIKRDGIKRALCRAYVVESGDVFILRLTAPVGDYCCARF